MSSIRCLELIQAERKLLFLRLSILSQTSDTIFGTYLHAKANLVTVEIGDGKTNLTEYKSAANLYMLTTAPHTNIESVRFNTVV